MTLVFIQNKAVSEKSFGVIAATGIDTKFGLDLLEDRGITGYGYSITGSPQEQTLLQALEKKQLTDLVIDAAKKLEDRKVSGIMIYCNSLSGAIDLKAVRSQLKVKVITPLDIYTKIALSHKKIGLLAANGQSVGNLERYIVDKNPEAVVIGYGNLHIVNEIEKGTPAADIVRRYNVDLVCRSMEKEVELIILGCTHFPYIYNVLKSQTKSDIFEPSSHMISALLMEDSL